MIVRNEEIDVGTSYVLDIKNFRISDRHPDVHVYALSERWGIIWPKLL